MAQLFFRYGQMNASKSAQLLMTAHNYEEQGRRVLIFSPSIDERYGKRKVASRIGISKTAIPIDNNLDIISTVKNEMPDCVLVDEAQFLRENNILDFVYIVDKLNIPVICYGLLRDYRAKLFEGSEVLVRFADKLEEIKTICTYCNRKATMILKFKEGKPVYEGDQIEIGGNELYKSVCRKHWFNPPQPQ
ncbi:MAG: thymidine kinase [Desulfitibacter sp. BRH_c19]|nr:MAG: thymidine kinase [Desulfitibacter sp. BRH_c19]